MKKFSKVLALGLAATMLGGTFVGCQSSTTEDSTTTNESTTTTDDTATDDVKTPVTLRTISMFGGTDPNAVTYEKYKNEFLAANSHIKIEDESATADETWKASIVTDFSAGNEPDVMFFFTDVTAAPIVEQDKVVSIEEIRAEYPEYAQNINPAALESAAAANGEQYAVPTHGYYEALFCNEDVFQANNLDLPTDWAKLEAAIEGFAQTDITPIAVALGHVPHYWIEHLILAAGGVEDHSNRDIAAVKDSWVTGLSYFQKFGEMGAFPIDTAATQDDLTKQAFIDKQSAMFLDGSWAVG
ncbi:MAG: ABC transporter substrate-binding protein, partial [Cellulosilyticaceae bacterium]